VSLQTAIVNECIDVRHNGCIILLVTSPFTSVLYILIYFEKSHVHTLTTHIHARTRTHTHTYGKQTDEQMSDDYIFTTQSGTFIQKLLHV